MQFVSHSAIGKFDIFEFAYSIRSYCIMKYPMHFVSHSGIVLARASSQTLWPYGYSSELLSSQTLGFGPMATLSELFFRALSSYSIGG